jgi:DNA repair protein RecO (recombination protein O)
MKLIARHDPHPALFDAYAQTLPALGSEDDARVQAALRAFEITLLQQIGLLPDLTQVTLTLDAVNEDAGYVLLPEAGVAAVRTGEPPIPGAALIGLQAALAHGSIPALQHACATVLPELKTMLRALLHYHLGTPMLRTRQVMLDVQNLER